MKRYRVICLAFDSRSYWLTHDISDEWSDEVKQQHYETRARQIAELKREYGEYLAEDKIRNFADLGQSPFSIVSYHTEFLEQIRRAFVGFGYYPALTGACALGERILNHLVLKLREHYRDSPEYKQVCRKQSFDDWKRAIDVLDSWGVLLPEVVEAFRKLHCLRNGAVHFQLEVEKDSRSPALEAIRLVKDIISKQFSAFGDQPWFIPGIPGQSYISKEAENCPFVREFYLPCCAYVGPYHKVVEITPQMEFRIADNGPYEEREISDEEFAALLPSRRTEG